MKRRNFIIAAAITGATLLHGDAISEALAIQNETVSKPSNLPVLPRREYGKTGIQLSIIGMGGVVVRNEEQDHANRIVAESIERGVNYFDVAPTYGDAEERLGPALEPYRKNCFLACKTTQRTKEGATKELKQSLQRLRTDYLDLYQLHSIKSVQKDVDVAFGKEGAMKVFTEAKKSGQVRHLGFSAHSVEAALEAMDRYDFDSILFPVNFACWYAGNFGSQVIKKAQEKGAAVLAIKAIAHGKWQEKYKRRRFPKCWYMPLSEIYHAQLALRFTLSQPVTATVPPGEEILYRLALDMALNFQPITSEEIEELKILAQKVNPIFTA